MKVLLSVILALLLLPLHAQTEWVRIFTDYTAMHRIDTNGELIAAVGQRDGEQIALKILNKEGEVLGESTEHLRYRSSYDDVIVVSDSLVIAGAHFIGNVQVGGGAGSAFRFYSPNAEVKYTNYFGTFLNSRGTCSLAEVNQDRFLVSAGGKMSYLQWYENATARTIESNKFDASTWADYHFLENWRDSLAVLISNRIDSLSLHHFNGERVSRIALDRDISATLLHGDTLWMADDTLLYRVLIPSLQLEEVSPLPRAPLTIGLQWLPEEEQLFMFERGKSNSSQFWHFDPLTNTWEDIGVASFPGAKLMDMVYQDGYYTYCGVFIDTLGKDNSFIGRSLSPLFELPVQEADLAVEVQLVAVDTSTEESWGENSVELRTFWEAEITLTNNGTAPTGTIIWESEEFVSGYDVPRSWYDKVSGNYYRPIQPNESVTFTVRFSEESFVYDQEELEAAIAKPYTLCFYAIEEDTWRDAVPANNYACSTGQAMFMEEEEEEVEEEVYKLYPNPAEGTLHLQSPVDPITSWTIFGILGNTIASESLSVPDKQIEIILPPLSPGQYWIRMQTADGQSWRSFYAQ